MAVGVDQLAIQTVADAHRSLERFDVNVRCLHAHRLGERVHHQADDGCVVAITATTLTFVGGDHDAVFLALNGTFNGVELREVILNVANRGTGKRHLTTGDHGQTVEGLEVEWVGNRHLEGEAIVLHRHAHEALCDLSRNLLHQ